MLKVRPAVRFIPAIGVVVTWAALMPADGGYFARDWLLAGAVIAGLWLLAVVGGGRLVPDGTAERVALAALGAMCVLAFLSMAWAPSRATAWSTASQFLTVVLAVWTLALAPWRALPAQVLFGAFAIAAAAAFGGALQSSAAATNLAGSFIDARFAQPIGYPNALGNFGFFAALPVLAVSVVPRLHWSLKGPALALAAFLGACSLLPQSRGATLAMIVAVPVLLALSPFRWRMAARLGIVGGAVALASGPVLGLYDVVVDEVGVGAALDDAIVAILLATGVAGAAGLLLGILEARVPQGERTRRVARLSGAVALALVALGGVGAAAVNADRIDRLIDRQRANWERPNEVVEDGGGSGTRLLSSNPLQRYRYWHLALDAFAERPVAGIGAGGFEHRYTRTRIEPKYSSYPHSLAMRVLMETGVLGVLGVLAFLGAVLFGLLRGLRHASADDRAVTAGAVAAAACFAVHAQLDWLEEFPVLAGPAVGFLLVAMAVRRGGETEPRPLRPLPIAAAVAIAAAAFATLLPAYASVRYRERASVISGTDAAKAYRDLDRAKALDPFSDTPALIEGSIALRMRDLPRARAAFEEAVERDKGWLAYFELSLTLAAQGDREAAMRQLEAASSLNPQEPAIEAARKVIEAGEVVDPVRLNKRLFESPLFKTRRLT